MLNRKKLKIHPSVFVIIGFFIYIGQIKILLLTFLFVTIHELAHSAAAVMLGAKLCEILITPIGERAIIKNMELLSPFKRFLIFLIGPLVNITLGLIFKTWFYYNEIGMFIAEINLGIGFFNLLPFLPLDGGRILLLMGDNLFGTLRSGDFMVKMSQLFGWFLVMIGVIQVIMFPFNISLLVIGLYFKECNKREYINIAFEFYKNMMNIRDGKIERPIRIREFLVSKNTRLNEVIPHFSIDFFYIICIIEDGEIVRKTQNEVLDCAMENGIWSNFGECLLE